MEKQRAIAEKHGFHEAVDCGAFSLHVFHEDYLTQNTAADKIIRLASATFSEDNVPCLESSELELLPKTETSQGKLAGFINFEMPMQWQRGEFTFDVLLRKLQSHLSSKVEYAAAELTIDQRTLLVHDQSLPEAMQVQLEASHEGGLLELHAPFSAEAPGWYQYDEIMNASTLWGHLHDFVAQSGELPYRSFKDAPENKLFVGETTPEMQVSETEIIVVSTLEEIERKFGPVELPNVSDDIELTVDTFSAQLSGQQLDDAIFQVILSKRQSHKITGEMSAISQGDLIAAFAQQQRIAHQENL